MAGEVTQQRFPLLRGAWRQIKLLLLCLLVYLLQSCVIVYLPVGGMTGSLIMACIAVVIVALGRIRGFWAGAFFGIALETMQPTVPMFNLILYPAAALLCSVPFADKTQQQLEQERSQGKPGRNISYVIRTPACAFMLAVIYETVNVVYIYLRGTTLTGLHISRALLGVLLTFIMCIVFMNPMRAFLGYGRPRKAKREEVMDIPQLQGFNMGTESEWMNNTPDADAQAETAAEEATEATAEAAADTEAAETETEEETETTVDESLPVYGSAYDMDLDASYADDDPREGGRA